MSLSDPQLEPTSDRVTLIRFQIGTSILAVHFEQVTEIAEFHEYVEYPEASPGCLGILNLRGQLIPLFELPHYGTAQGLIRVLVLEIDSRRFGILVTHPKKIEVSTDSLGTDSNIFSYQSETIRLLTETTFLPLLPQLERSA